MLSSIAQVIIIIGFPVLTIWASSQYSIIEKISPIVLCFAIGILLCNFTVIDIDPNISNIFRDGAILLALPLLLFSSDLKSWIKNSKTLIIAFGLCIISGLIACTIAAYVFHNTLSDVWIPSGMMVGIYTGGTPNLFAVGMALGAKDEVFTLLNSAEIFWGALYLLFLLSPATSFLNRIITYNPPEEVTSDNKPYLTYDSIDRKETSLGVLLALIVVGVSVVISHLIKGNIDPTIIIVLITSISILASMRKEVRRLKGTFAVGDYFLLIFGVAAGMLSDFQSLINDGREYITFVLVILLITLSVNILLARLLKIDRDTFLISSAAGLYGPVFIPQVARAINNRSIIIGGISVSLIGLAVGNYLGIFLGTTLHWLLQ